MVICAKDKGYIFDAYDDGERSKNKRHDSEEILRGEADGMFSVKTFPDRVERACSDVAENDAEASNC